MTKGATTKKTATKKTTVTKTSTAKTATKKSPAVKSATTKKPEPETKVTAEDINSKLKATVEARTAKELAEDKRLYKYFQKNIDSAYKKMETCYLDTAFALHSIYKLKLYKLDNYKNIYDFAKDKYNISRGTCNNFINISERFGIRNEKGNISKLAPQYENYGVSQLAVMLTFPTVLLEKCNSKISVRELKRMREEYEKEETENKRIPQNEESPVSTSNQSPIEELLTDDITGGDIAGTDGDNPAGNTPMNPPVNLDIPKSDHSVHICTAKDFAEFSGLFGIIEETYNDIVLGNKKKKARIRVDVVFE